MSVSSRNPWHRLLLFLLVFPVVLVPVEWLVARVKGAGEARNDTIAATYMPIRLKPNFSGEVSGMRFSTNDYGLRGDEKFPLTPPPGEGRVLALGDSVGFGWGIDLSQQYTKVLEARLNGSSPHSDLQTVRWRVINAAGQGYSPSSYHAYLGHEGLAYQPRLVLIQVELCNDVTDEALLFWQGQDDFGGPRRVRGGRYVVAWDGNLLGSMTWGPYLPEETYVYTLLMRRLLTTWWNWWPRGVFAQQLPPPYFHLDFDRPFLTADRVEAGWQRLFDALGATRRLLEARRIPMLLLILPSRFVFEPDQKESTRQARAFLERAARMARQRGVEYQLFEGELARAGGAALYFDFAHPDATGNRLIGEALAETVQSRLGRRE